MSGRRRRHRLCLIGKPQYSILEDVYVFTIRAVINRRRTLPPLIFTFYQKLFTQEIFAVLNQAVFLPLPVFFSRFAHFISFYSVSNSKLRRIHLRLPPFKCLGLSSRNPAHISRYPMIFRSMRPGIQRPSLCQPRMCLILGKAPKLRAMYKDNYTSSAAQNTRSIVVLLDGRLPVCFLCLAAHLFLPPPFALECSAQWRPVFSPYVGGLPSPKS